MRIPSAWANGVVTYSSSFCRSESRDIVGGQSRRQSKMCFSETQQAKSKGQKEKTSVKGA